MDASASLKTEIPARFRERLQELRVPVIRMSSDGAVAIDESMSWIERLVVGSRPFAAAAQARWSDISESPATVIELWPGVSVVPLPENQRRRLETMRCRLSLYAALIIGPSVVNSEQLLHICREAELDYRAAAAKIDPTRLTDAAEAERLAVMLAWMCEDTSELDRQSRELDALSQELADSYEELSLLYKFSTNMVLDQEPAQFLNDACSELQQVLALRWIAVCLIDDDPRLEDLAGRQFVAGHPRLEPKRFAQLAGAMLKRYEDITQPVIIDDTTSVGVPDLVATAGNLLIVPLRNENGRLGIIIGGDKLDSATITSVDSKLCDSLSNSLTIFLENLMLFEDSQAMFMGTLHALTQAIDAKDSYTHGHSERVALMSKRLAEAAGMSPADCERIYVAGLVHDVGKIGVPESVLTKPGRLTDEEFAQIKRHPEIGANIVKRIRQMQDLIPGVLYHHERWDGRGYPHGLSGTDVPLMGRVIGLADAFDAMSSNRTYRSALDRAKVLDEIKRCAGTQFDPDLADVFISLDFSEFDRLIDAHQTQWSRKSA